VIDAARALYRICCWTTATALYTELLGPNRELQIGTTTERQRERADLLDGVAEAGNYGGSPIAGVTEQIDLAVETLDPDRIGDAGLEGDQAAAESVDSAGWVTRQAQVTTDALNLFSQDVKFLNNLNLYDTLATAMFEHANDAAIAADEGDLGGFLGAAGGALVAQLRFLIDAIGRLGSLTVGTIINAAVGTVMIQVLKFWTLLGTAGIVLGEDPGLVDPGAGVFG